MEKRSKASLQLKIKINEIEYTISINYLYFNKTIEKFHWPAIHNLIIITSNIKVIAFFKFTAASRGTLRIKIKKSTRHMTIQYEEGG